MSLVVYIVSAILVFVFSGLLAMAGLGAAFLFVPLFYYLGVPLAEATPTALLLNVVSLLFAAITYWRAKLINWRVGLPVLVTAVILSPLGALLTPRVNKKCSPVDVRGLPGFCGNHDALLQGTQTGEGNGACGRSGGGSWRRGRGRIPGWAPWAWAAATSSCPCSTGWGSTPRSRREPRHSWWCSLHFQASWATPPSAVLTRLFIGITAVMAAAGSIVGSQLMKTKISSNQLKRMIGILLWLIAAKMIWDLVK